jgi:hypothetical protein
MNSSFCTDVSSLNPTQNTTEPDDCFDNFDIDFFGHLNNSTEVSEDESSFHKANEGYKRKHNSTKRFQSNETAKDKPQHMLLEIDLKQFLHTIRTHRGSLSLQMYLSSFPEHLMNSLLKRISPILINIMCSHYGNYFFQKLLQSLNLTQRMFIFNQIKNQIIKISTHKSGTYSIQALIGELKTETERETILNILAPFYHILFTNENAYHIILKLIIDYPEHKRASLNQFLINNICSLAQNQYSYTCISKFIILNTNINIRMYLINELSRNFVNLISFTNGCNIILLIVEKLGGEYINFIYNEMMNNLSYLIQNGSSYINSIEKILINMYRYNPTRFINMLWKIFENEYFNNMFFSYENGSKFLSILFQFALPEQKSFFLLRNKQFLQGYLSTTNNYISFGM